MKMIAIVLLLVSGAVANAGSGMATIECQSGSGRTRFSAASEDMGPEASQVKFVIDGVELNFDQGSIIFQLQDRILTVTSGHDKPSPNHIQLWAIPSSVQYSEAGYSTHATFTARVIGTDPRPEKLGNNSPVITVKCELDYSI